MAGIHVTLTPNIIAEPAKIPLVLKIDSPASAQDVKVQLVEMDSNIPREGGRDDVIAIFDGRIVPVEGGRRGKAGEKGKAKKTGKFQGRLVRESEPQKGAPTFKFKFEHDGTIHELLIPSGRGEHEHGEYEIGVKISGEVAGRSRTFVSEAPAYIRGLPQANKQASHRPAVTFFAGKKKGDKYYKSANAFWYPVSDGIKYNMSLQEIIAWLSDNTNSKTKDGMDFGKWGEINIVSHATATGWTSLRVFKGNKKIKLSLKSVKKFKDDTRLALNSDDSGIDKDTTIIWRGCNVGKSQEFLEVVRKLFGGKSRVYAPKYYQQYEMKWIEEPKKGKKKTMKVTHAWEYFWEDFYFDIPWPDPKKGKKGWRKPKLLPSKDACAERLMEEHPNAKYKGGANAGKTLDKKGWLTLLKSKKNRDDSKKPITYQNTIPFRGNPRNYRKLAIGGLKNYDDFDHRDYTWQIKVMKLKKESELYKKGYRWQIACRGAAVKEKPFTQELPFEKKPANYRKVAQQRLKASMADEGQKYEDFLWKIKPPEKLKRKERKDYKEYYGRKYSWKIVCNGYFYKWQFSMPFRGNPRKYRKMVVADVEAIGTTKDEYGDDYPWKVGKPKRVTEKEEAYAKGYRWKVICTGYKYRVKVKRILRDNNGEIIVPNLLDDTHYGHEG